MKMDKDVFLMANCIQCGAPLRAGALFCTNCGAKVAPVSPVASAAPAAADLPDTYPSMLGRYESGHCKDTVSASDRAIVWAHCGDIFRMDTQDDLISKSFCVESLVQTPDGIRAVTVEDDETKMTRTFSVVELDDDLQELSRRNVMTVPIKEPLYDNFAQAVLSEHYLFLAKQSKADPDVVFTRINLEDNSVVDVTWRAPGVLLRRLLPNGGKLYIKGRTPKGTEFFARVAFGSNKVFAIWKSAGCSGGEPHFFDFGQKFMWTELSDEEMKERGLSRDCGEVLLAARAIRANAPILDKSPIVHLPSWAAVCAHFSYCDTRRCYIARSYNNFSALPHNSTQAVTWHDGDHGRSEETVVWPQQGIVIADLNADDAYTAYPLNYNPATGRPTPRKLTTRKV